MSDQPVLFDMTPLTPNEVIRRRGVHPVSMLALDPDESRTCGNCATRRWVFDETACEWRDTVCAAISRCKWKPARGLIAAGPPGPDDYCDDPCCTPWHDDPPWSRPWPWDEMIDPEHPACTRWTDLLAERVVVALEARP